MDPLLHDIYSKETSSHLTEIREYLRKRAGQPSPHDLPEAVYRAIHTLSGSSKMAEARHGIRITEPLNHFTRKVFDCGRGLTDLGLTTLADAVQEIDNVVSHINENTAFFSHQPLLLERLQQLEAELDADLARVANDTSGSEFVPSPAAPEVPPAAEEFDHEIANIYSEEATELLEAADVSLSAWNKDRKDKDRVAELQRQLHTLKGGARMAGITAMGDLSHELETLVIQIDGGHVLGDDLAHSVMQASLDALAHMRESVKAKLTKPGAG
jgi:chemosensory pili system protein ChpA (sensor histidine kinase/response regulator)